MFVLYNNDYIKINKRNAHEDNLSPTFTLYFNQAFLHTFLITIWTFNINVFRLIIIVNLTY